MAKLINYQFLRLEVDISQNVPDEELDNPIKRSQEMLEMIIGTYFYAQLISQNPNFDTANTLFKPYFQKFLAWQGYQFWLPKANFKATRAGLRVMTEENSVVASDAQMATLIRDAKEWAQTHKENMVSFLDANASDYPLWTQKCGTRKRTGNGFHISAIGGHHKHCGCSKCHGH